jgi:hypothetical protein
MNLAFRGPITPPQREPRFDGDEVVLQVPREADHLCDAAVRRRGYPRLQVLASALPGEGQKGLAQRIGPRTLASTQPSWAR